MGFLFKVDPILSSYPIGVTHILSPRRSVCLKRLLNLIIRSLPHMTPKERRVPKIIPEFIFLALADRQIMDTKVVVFGFTMYCEDFVVQFVRENECILFVYYLPEASTKKNEKDDEIFHFFKLNFSLICCKDIYNTHLRWYSYTFSC